VSLSVKQKPLRFYNELPFGLLQSIANPVKVAHFASCRDIAKLAAHWG